MDIVFQIRSCKPTHLSSEMRRVAGVDAADVVDAVVVVDVVAAHAVAAVVAAHAAAVAAAASFLPQL